MSEFESKALAIRENATSQKTISTKDVVMEAVGDIQRLYECRGAITGLECGFPGIDMVLDGLQPEMIVIAARPSQGKTALAMGMAEHIAIVGQKPVGVFSLEMSAKQLMKRSIASIAQVNLRALQQGFLAGRDFPAITAAANALQQAPLFIDDAAGLTIDELRGRARRWRFEKKVEAIFIDYLQLIRGTSKRAAENRQEEIREVSAGLKAMTKELGIPIVVLAQISRQFEQRGPMARPRLSDLKESGAIEQDADSVSFLVRRETAAETDEERQELAGQAELIIAKQRNGPLGDVPLTFIKEFTRFESRAEGNFEEADAVAAREQEKERQRAKDRAENDLPM
jgi:replicative DNA helicase